MPAIKRSNIQSLGTAFWSPKKKSLDSSYWRGILSDECARSPKPNRIRIVDYMNTAGDFLWKALQYKLCTVQLDWTGAALLVHEWYAHFSRCTPSILSIRDGFSSAFHISQDAIIISSSQTTQQAGRRFGLDRERSTALDIIAGLATNELHTLQELSMKFLCTGMTVLI